MQFNIGYAQVLLSGIGFGFLGVFGKLAFANNLSIGDFLTYRFVMAASILWIFLILFKRDIVRLQKKQIRNSLLLGVFGYAVFSTCYFKAIEGLSISLAAMLLFTFPIFVNLGEHFYFKQKMKPKEWFSLALAMLGMVILLWGDLEVRSYVAAIYGILASITYSIYVIVSGRVQKNVKPLSSSLYVMTSAAILFLIIHQPSFSVPQEQQFDILKILLGISIISTIGPMTLFLAGLQKMPSGQASILVMIEPVTAAIAGYFILNEAMTYTQILGTIVVLTALVINAQARTNKSALQLQ